MESEGHQLPVVLPGTQIPKEELELLGSADGPDEGKRGWKSREGQNPPSTATHTFGMFLSREAPKIIVGRTKASLGWQTFQTTEKLEESKKKNNWNGKGLSGQQKTTKGKLTSFQNSQSRGRTVKTPNYAQFNSKAHKEMQWLLQRKGVGRSYNLTTFQRGIKKQFSHTRPGRQPGPLGALSLECQILKCISNPKGSAEGEAGTETNIHWVQLRWGEAAKEWHSTMWFSGSVTTAIFSNLGWNLAWQALNSGKILSPVYSEMFSWFPCAVSQEESGVDKLSYHWKEFFSGEFWYSQDLKI